MTESTRLQHRCPSCGGQTLFVSPTGWITCSLLGCRDPGAAGDALDAANAPIGPMYRQRVTPVTIVDGDTFDFQVDVGFSIGTKQRIRLRGIDTPEVKGVTKPRGLAAKAFSEERIARAASVITETHKLPDGQRDVKTLGRYVADVWVDGVPLARLLRDAGHVADVERLG